MTRLRVAYVAHSVDPRRGGMELVSARLIERLAIEVDLEVVAGDGLETLPVGVRRTRIPIPDSPSLARLVIFDAIATVRLRAVRRRVDLVHSCGVVAHGRSDLVTVHLSHASVVEAQGMFRPPGRTGIRGAAGALRRRLALGLEHWGLRPGRVRCVAAVSRADEVDLAARYPSLPVRLVENGIDLDQFLAIDRTTRPDGEPLRVVVVAGDFERKGVGLVLEALAKAPSCVVRVAGDGDLASMRLRASHLGVAERVEFLGHRADVAHEYAWADVVLSCSVHESFGLSLVEGAASGCAVVSTDTGAAQDLCRDEGAGAGGIVVERDPSSVAAALESLSRDPHWCRAMGANARQRASRFTWDAMAARTARIYAQLAQGEIA